MLSSNNLRAGRLLHNTSALGRQSYLGRQDRDNFTESISSCWVWAGLLGNVTSSE